MKCITVSYGRVAGKMKNYPYFQPVLYEEYTTKDNRKLWKYVDHIGTPRRSIDLAKYDAKEISKQDSIPYIPGVRNWTPITISQSS